MIGWITFGSLLTLATALALSTFYYRRRARRAENKSQSDAQIDRAIPVSQNQPSRSRKERKYKSRGRDRGDRGDRGEEELEQEFSQYFIGSQNSSNCKERFELGGGM